MESCGMFLQAWLTWLMVFELKKGKLLDDNFEDTRFEDTILNKTAFPLRNLETILPLPSVTVSASYGSTLIDLQCELVHQLL